MRNEDDDGDDDDDNHNGNGDNDAGDTAIKSQSLEKKHFSIER